MNKTSRPIEISIRDARTSPPIKTFQCLPGVEGLLGIPCRGAKFVTCVTPGDEILSANLVLADHPLMLSFTERDICNICGHESFGSGPNGRASLSGKPPRCLHCGSLERHRALRTLYSSLRPELDERSCLQFSVDEAINAAWFRSVEVSIYNGQNSLDIQSIDRPDGTYGFVICNHVLEHVERDDLAVRELMRILANDGILQFSVPDPLRYSMTADWGWPDPIKHGHFRTYGSDLFRARLAPLLDHHVISATIGDDVTGHRDVVFFCMHSAEVAQRIETRLASWGFSPKFEAPTGELGK